MNRPWFPFYVGDYTRDTARLTTEAHGAYLLLILDYWVNGPPPDDNEVLATITKLPVSIWRKRRPSILPFFKVVDGRWIHSRIDREIAAAEEKHQKRVDAGKEGGKAKARGKQTASNASQEPPALPYQSQSQPPSEPIQDSKKGESNSRPDLKLVEEGQPIPIDENYQPSDRAEEYAYSLGMKKADLNSELSKFIALSMASRAKSYNPDMSFKAWCDRWLDFKRQKDPDWKPAPEPVSAPQEPYVLVVQGTQEAAAWSIVLRERGCRPLFFSKHLVDGAEIIAARCSTLWPEGFNDFGERIDSEEHAA